MVEPLRMLEKNKEWLFVNLGIEEETAKVNYGISKTWMIISDKLFEK